MTRQDTEEFRGCGFIEFGSTEEADKAVRLDGKDVLGRCVLSIVSLSYENHLPFSYHACVSCRPIRIDWTD